MKKIFRLRFKLWFVLIVIGLKSADFDSVDTSVDSNPIQTATRRNLKTGIPQIANQVYFQQTPIFSNSEAQAIQLNPQSGYSDSALREPANIPTNINPDNSRYIDLEKFLKNQYESSSQGPINLASINERRMDPSSRHDSSPLVRKGKVDSVVYPKIGGLYRPTPAKQLVNQVSHKLQFPVEKWAQKCIINSAPQTSRCEDHLIKRLAQDASEGRTVIDVSRRLCCALFWHKDCINRIVLETCPDSSPVAADYLLGSRKLDLTLSCQKFNRDGCNGALRSVGISRISTFLSLVVSSMYIYLNIFIW